MILNIIKGPNLCALDYAKQLNRSTCPEKIFLGQGCNCQGKMGAGFARFITTLYPEVKHADHVFSTLTPSKQRLGRFSSVEVVAPDKRKLTIVNLYTQLYYSRTEKQFDALALEKALQSFHDRYGDNCIMVIPPIGAGLGLADFDTEVMPVLEASPVKVIVVWRETEDN